jgi:hypothetical protein
MIVPAEIIVITFKAGNSVILPNGRTGIVYEVDIENRKALCAIDPTNELVGAVSASGWFESDELRPQAIAPRPAQSSQ